MHGQKHPVVMGQSGCSSILTYIYMVVDLKVLVSSVYDDDPEHIKISFGESFFSSWRK